MRSATLLSVLSSEQSLLSLAQKVFKLNRLDEIGVPHCASIRNSNVLVLIAYFLDLMTAAF